MWAEPLTADTTPIGDCTVAVTVRAGDGAPVASVRCAVNRADGFAIFGEMNIDDPSGAPRQRLRALVLLVREALRYGAEIGVVSACTEAPLRMAAFAARMTGQPGEPFGPRVRFAGELHVMRSATLNATDPRGEFLEAAPAVDGL
jgi:hypothetical protein